MRNKTFHNSSFPHRINYLPEIPAHLSYVSNTWYLTNGTIKTVWLRFLRIQEDDLTEFFCSPTDDLGTFSVVPVPIVLRQTHRFDVLTEPNFIFQFNNCYIIVGFGYLIRRMNYRFGYLVIVFHPALFSRERTQSYHAGVPVKVESFQWTNWSSGVFADTRRWGTCWRGNGLLSARLSRRAVSPHRTTRWIHWLVFHRWPPCRVLKFPTWRCFRRRRPWLSWAWFWRFRKHWLKLIMNSVD